MERPAMRAGRGGCAPGVARVLAAVSCVLASSAAAQPDSDITDQTGWVWYFNVTESTIFASIQSGRRLVDIEVVSTSPVVRYDAALVSNAGAHEKEFVWGRGVTESQVVAGVEQNNLTVIDIEPYATSSGIRYTSIAVADEGPDGDGVSVTNVLFDRTEAEVQDWFDNVAVPNNLRATGIEPYLTGAGLRYALTYTANSGANFKETWATLTTLTPDDMRDLVDDGLRPIDLEPLPNDPSRFAAVFVPFDVGFTWWFGLDFDTFTKRPGTYGHRPVDLQRYTVNGQTRFAGVFVENDGESDRFIASTMGLFVDRSEGDWGAHAAGV